ncbi:hypothetical protein K474DRAFT_1698255 [Panus rudis PR-1116 ss-1]|nr:hypothetical protein K474DRAFT_1698255 [Panus rudis PR-1116 ss-1]
MDQPVYEPLDNTEWWMKMNKVIRGMDEAKIKDYKEDIDTLLVFGGLLSAVMTTFLIDSYKSLSEDPSVSVVRALAHISQQMQSLAATSGAMNSIPALPDPPPFSPPAAAKRTNVLCILVKQWLHEYLAGDYASPQAQLRCPYKTTFLKHILKRIRRLLFHFAPYHRLYVTLHQSSPRDSAYITDALGPLTISSEKLLEEDDAAKQEELVCSMLTEVDAIHIDDHLICSALQDPVFLKSEKESDIVDIKDDKKHQAIFKRFHILGQIRYI